MLEYLFEGEPLEDESESEYEYDTSIRNDRNETAVERFLDGYRTWLADGTYSPMSAIIYWMSFGRGYRERENGAARLAWESDGTTLSYEGQRIRVSDFQITAQRMVQDTEALLDELMDGQWYQMRETIRIRDIIDSLIYEGVGRSFATNARNGWFKPGAGKMAELIGSQLWKETDSARSAG
jgi:hypothetical protein